MRTVRGANQRRDGENKSAETGSRQVPRFGFCSAQSSAANPNVSPDQQRDAPPKVAKGAIPWRFGEDRRKISCSVGTNHIDGKPGTQSPNWRVAWHPSGKWRSRAGTVGLGGFSLVFAVATLQDLFIPLGFVFEGFEFVFLFRW